MSTYRRKAKRTRPIDNNNTVTWYDPEGVLVVTRDGVVIYDPRDGYTLVRREMQGHLRRVLPYPRR